MTPYVDDGDMRLYIGDCLDVLRELPDESVDCCVTSPPYWGLRDYGTGEWDGGSPDCDHRVREDARVESSTLSGGKATTGHEREGFKEQCPRCGARRVDRQLGLEPTPDQYVQNMVAVFHEVRRVLAPHGTCWVNLGDSYANVGQGSAYGWTNGKTSERDKKVLAAGSSRGGIPDGLKPKDLVGSPWRVAFALQADGWWLRSDIVWSKPNPMPEAVTDRPTKAHEYLFLLTKRSRYWFDAEAVREPHKEPWRGNGEAERNNWSAGGTADSRGSKETVRLYNPAGRNVRSVWDIATQPFPGAHFATFPEELARRAIVAGCPEWVCGVCGRPRERIVDVSYQINNRTGGANATPRGGTSRDGPVIGEWGMTQKKDKLVETVGWSDCGHNAYRPGRVLDPFAGAGTVGLVARKHARHSVLIELSEQYAREILLPRLSQLSLLAEAGA